MHINQSNQINTGVLHLSMSTVINFSGYELQITDLTCHFLKNSLCK